MSVAQPSLRVASAIVGVPVGDREPIGGEDRRVEEFGVGPDDREAPKGGEEIGGIGRGDPPGATPARGLHVELLEDLHREREVAVAEQLLGALGLTALLRRAGDQVEEDVGAGEAQGREAPRARAGRRRASS